MGKTRRNKGENRRKNRPGKWSKLHERLLSRLVAMEPNPQQQGSCPAPSHHGHGSEMYGGPGGLYNGGSCSNSGHWGPSGSPGLNGACSAAPKGFVGVYGMGGPPGVHSTNNTYRAPASPPEFWISLLNVMQDVVNFFGRVSVLVDQNTKAIHMLMTAILQLFDRSGSLYGELAKFVLKILGTRKKPRNVQLPAAHDTPLPSSHGRKTDGESMVATSSWDTIWATDCRK